MHYQGIGQDHARSMWKPDFWKINACCKKHWPPHYPRLAILLYIIYLRKKTCYPQFPPHLIREVLFCSASHLAPVAYPVAFCPAAKLRFRRMSMGSSICNWAAAPVLRCPLAFHISYMHSSPPKKIETQNHGKIIVRNYCSIMLGDIKCQ